MINPYKYIRSKIEEFFEGEFTFEGKEAVFFIIIFCLMIVGSVTLPLLISNMASKISFTYFALVFMVIIGAANNDYDWLFAVAIHLAFPYLLMLILTSRIIEPFARYKGNDPMEMRYYKIRTLKRKARINKLKFWK